MTINRILNLSKVNSSFLDLLFNSAYPYNSYKITSGKNSKQWYSKDNDGI